MHDWICAGQHGLIQVSSAQEFTPNPSLLGTGRVFHVISTCGARLAGVIENPVRSKSFAYLQPAFDGYDYAQNTRQRCA